MPIYKYGTWHSKAKQKLNQLKDWVEPTEQALAAQEGMGVGGMQGSSINHLGNSDLNPSG